jgi:hypothetical protein
LYQSSGLRKSEFCRRHGMSLSTLSRYLQERQKSRSGGEDGGESRLVPVELAASDTLVSVGLLTLLLLKGRRIDIEFGYRPTSVSMEGLPMRFGGLTSRG